MTLLSSELKWAADFVASRLSTAVSCSSRSRSWCSRGSALLASPPSGIPIRRRPSPPRRPPSWPSLWQPSYLRSVLLPFSLHTTWATRVSSRMRASGAAAKNPLKKECSGLWSSGARTSFSKTCWCSFSICFSRGFSCASTKNAVNSWPPRRNIRTRKFA